MNQDCEKLRGIVNVVGINLQPGVYRENGPGSLKLFEVAGGGRDDPNTLVTLSVPLSREELRTHLIAKALKGGVRSPVRFTDEKPAAKAFIVTGARLESGNHRVMGREMSARVTCSCGAYHLRFEQEVLLDDFPNILAQLEGRGLNESPTSWRQIGIVTS